MNNKQIVRLYMHKIKNQIRISSPEIDQQLHRKHRLLIYCCAAIASLLLLCSWYSQKSSQAIVLYEFAEIQANDNIHK